MAVSSELVSRAAREPGRVQRWLRIRHGEGRLVLGLGMLRSASVSFLRPISLAGRRRCS